MTSTRFVPALLAGCLLTCPLMAGPPIRPLPLTRSQFSALQQLEREPANLAVREVHATYLSQHEMEMERITAIDDATTAATFLGYIGALTTILCIAAPL